MGATSGISTASSPMIESSPQLLSSSFLSCDCGAGFDGGTGRVVIGGLRGATPFLWAMTSQHLEHVRVGPVAGELPEPL